MSFVERTTCGRCGVYRHLHPTRTGCQTPRLSWWWHRHYLHRHVLTRAWWAMPERARWWVAARIHEARPHLCWCNLVDAVIDAQDDRRDDYRGEHGCACDAPLPIDAGLPRPGSCYCPPPGGPR